MDKDIEFFDALYQLWTKTTGAENTYWMPEEFAELHDGYKIVAFNPNTEEKETVAQYLTEADADFICGLHGALPELIRALHESHDEAERADEQRDLSEGAHAETLIELSQARDELREWERRYE